MDDEDFVAGYEYYRKVVEGGVSSTINDNTSTEYLGNINEKIQELSDSINGFVGDNRHQLHGFDAEVWARGTFNIDAASKRTGERVWIPPANDFASVDLQGNWEGSSYQVKFYKSGSGSAMAQAVSFKQEYLKYLAHCEREGIPKPTIEQYLKDRGVDPNIDVTLPIYEAQARLIPADQMGDAIEALKRKIADSHRPEEIARYQDTLNKLTDRIHSPNGAESVPLTREEAMTLAKLSREGKFDPARYDITLAKKADYLYLCKNTMTSGLSAALVSAVLKAAPDIATALIQLIKEGKIDESSIETIGGKLKSGANEGFIRGFCLAAIKNSCSLGFFGEGLQKAAIDTANPAFNNIAVVLIAVMTETIGDSVRLSKGEITQQTFMYQLERRVFISGCSIAVGSAIQGMMPVVPVLGYLIGSFVGTILGGLVFQAKEMAFMSLCVNKGYTFFGLVEQDYTLPEEVRKRLGLESIELEKFEFEVFQPETVELEQFKYETFEFEKIDIVMLKRGVVGLRKVGYVR